MGLILDFPSKPTKQKRLVSPGAKTKKDLMVKIVFVLIGLATTTWQALGLVKLCSWVHDLVAKVF